MVRINLLPVRVSKKKEAGKQQLMLFALVLFMGSAASIDDVSEFMGALRSSTQFKNVELGKTVAKTDKGFRLVEFTLSASVAYAPQAASEKPAGGPPARPSAGKGG
jgi:Tfp pilus assembly protein PilN